jgi:small-conductance mechanosensitive channel
MGFIDSAAKALPIVGPIVQGASAIGTNLTNLKIARDANALQERLSSTAHQREVKDLIAAGLNPVLSATKGMQGSSTPQANVAKMENPASGIMNSASQAMRLSDEIQKLRADSNLSNSLAREAEEKAETQASIRDTNTALQGKYQQEILESKARARQIDHNIEEIVARIGQIDEQIKGAKVSRMLNILKAEREKLFNQLFAEGNSAIDVYRDIYKKMNIDKPVKLYYDLQRAKDEYYRNLKKAWRNPAKYVAEKFMNAVKELRR